MKALIFGGKETISYETALDPKIVKNTDAIVKVQLCAICGSDLHVYHAREQGLDHGTIMGHEFMGEVVEVGKETSLQKGDIVISPFTTSCGHCFYCQTGLTCRCIYGELYGWVEGGKGLHGVQAEFARVPLADSTLIKLPKDISPEEGILLGDILSTGYYCAERAEITPKSICAIVGCGPVGLMAVIAAKELGAQKIFSIDTIEERLKLAQNFGAITINYKQQNPIELIKEATNGRGADCVLEVVGSQSSFKTAMDVVRPGGVISMVGVHTEPQFPFTPAEAYDKNLTYKIGRCPARGYMDKLLPLVRSKKYNLQSIVSHKLPLKEGEQGYKIFAQKLENCTKIVLNPWN